LGSEYSLLKNIILKKCIKCYWILGFKLFNIKYTNFWTRPTSFSNNRLFRPFILFLKRISTVFFKTIKIFTNSIKSREILILWVLCLMISFIYLKNTKLATFKKDKIYVIFDDFNKKMLYLINCKILKSAYWLTRFDYKYNNMYNKFKLFKFYELAEIIIRWWQDSHRTTFRIPRIIKINLTCVIVGLYTPKHIFIIYNTSRSRKTIRVFEIFEYCRVPVTKCVVNNIIM